MKWKKALLWGLPALFILIQAIRVDTGNPPVVRAFDFRVVQQPPADIAAMLETSCYDCHSNETHYPWYSQVAPVSWWLKNHVDGGRERLNFSTFGALSVPDRAEALEEMAEEVEKGAMPPDNYVWLHPKAELSPEQASRLAQWLRAANPSRQEYGWR